MMKMKLSFITIPVLALAAWVFIMPSVTLAEGQDNWPLERPAGNTEKQELSYTFKMQLAGLVALFAGGDKDGEAEDMLARMARTPSFTTFELQALRSQMTQVFFGRQNLDRAMVEAEALVAVDESNYFLVDKAHMQMAALYFLKTDMEGCLRNLYKVVPYQKNYTYEHLHTLAECHYYEAMAQGSEGIEIAMPHYSDALFFAFNTIKMFGWDGGENISSLSNAQHLGPILMASAWMVESVPEAYALLEETAAKNHTLDLWMFTLSAYDAYTNAGVALSSTLFDADLLQELAAGKSAADLEGRVQAIIAKRAGEAQ